MKHKSLAFKVSVSWTIIDEINVNTLNDDFEDTDFSLKQTYL